MYDYHYYYYYYFLLSYIYADRPVYSTVGFVAEVEKGEKYYTAVIFLQFIGKKKKKCTHIVQ